MRPTCSPGVPAQRASTRTTLSPLATDATNTSTRIPRRSSSSSESGSVPSVSMRWPRELMARGTALPRPLLLDLFCGAGGAAMGYHRAGFEVVGVDINPQPRYPFEFVQGDALAPPVDLTVFDAIHASPVCIRWTSLPLTAEQRAKHPDQITPLRPILEGSGRPYVIENVPRAPLRNRTLICGAAMGLRVVRHRYFETNWLLMSPGCAHRKGSTIDGEFVNFRPRGPLAPGRRMPARRSEDDFRKAAGTEFLTGQGARDAIPPAYTQFIGEQLLPILDAEEVTAETISP